MCNLGNMVLEGKVDIISLSAQNTKEQHWAQHERFVRGKVCVCLCVCH